MRDARVRGSINESVADGQRASGRANSSMPIIVVKCGGNMSVATDLVCADIAELVARGQRIVVAHGGSGDVDRLAARMQVPRRTLRAPDGVVTRHTDAAMLEIVTLALAGASKPRLVTSLAKRGVAAVGLTGLDGALLQARRKAPLRAVMNDRIVVVRDNYGGKVTAVNTQLLLLLLGAGFVPVVSPPALAADGTALNVDADRAAAAVASALGASSLVFLTAARGVLRVAGEERSRLDVCRIPGAGSPPSYARARMALKLVGAREALRGGVIQVIIADGRVEQPLQRALQGEGTRVELDEAVNSVGADEHQQDVVAS